MFDLSISVNATKLVAREWLVDMLPLLGEAQQPLTNAQEHVLTAPTKYDTNGKCRIGPKGKSILRGGCYRL